MPVRLSVLILKPPAKFLDRFENVVGECLGRPGLDVVMLERLPRADDDATEGLALQSLSGPIACLVWTDVASVMEEMEAAGKQVRRRKHARDHANTEDEADPSASPVYFFDLRSDGAHQTILKDLQHLLASLRVPTFQLQHAVKPKVKKSPKRADSSGELKSQGQPPESTGTVESESESPSPTSAPSPAKTLDQLVDDLDAMDL